MENQNLLDQLSKLRIIQQNQWGVPKDYHINGFKGILMAFYILILKGFHSSCLTEWRRIIMSRISTNSKNKSCKIKQRTLFQSAENPIDLEFQVVNIEGISNLNTIWQFLLMINSLFHEKIMENRSKRRKERGDLMLDKKGPGLETQ